MSPRGGPIPLEGNLPPNERPDGTSDFSSTLPNILFVSHCIPNPPNKGEKIRAFHLINYLASRYRVHLACFAHTDAEAADAQALKSICSSIYVQKLPRIRLVRGGLRLMLGGCLNAGYYWSPQLKDYVDRLAGQVGFRATLIYSVVMMSYRVEGVPVVLDMQDVDSEKWFSYAESRKPGFLYGLEAKRLRTFERESAQASRCTVLTTRNEEELLRRFAPDATTTYMENGVDTDYFADQAAATEFQGRRFIAFIGTMNYYPNIDGVCWFAQRIFPELRRRDRGLEFLVIGRHPVKAVQELASIDGVKVIGGVADIRPFIASALAIVTPLRIARGIQNKVLEALAMGRKVYASDAVSRTFGSDVPRGVVSCASEEEFVTQLAIACQQAPAPDPEIRRAACARFSWSHNLETMSKALDEIIYGRASAIDAAQRPILL